MNVNYGFHADCARLGGRFSRGHSAYSKALFLAVYPIAGSLAVMVKIFGNVRPLRDLKKAQPPSLFYDDDDDDDHHHPPRPHRYYRLLFSSLPCLFLGVISVSRPFYKVDDVKILCAVFLCLCVWRCE